MPPQCRDAILLTFWCCASPCKTKHICLVCMKTKQNKNQPPRTATYSQTHSFCCKPQTEAGTKSLENMPILSTNTNFCVACILIEAWIHRLKQRLPLFGWVYRFWVIAPASGGCWCCGLWRCRLNYCCCPARHCARLNICLEFNFIWTRYVFNMRLIRSLCMLFYFYRFNYYYLVFVAKNCSILMFKIVQLLYCSVVECQTMKLAVLFNTISDYFIILCIFSYSLSLL